MRCVFIALAVVLVADLAGHDRSMAQDFALSAVWLHVRCVPCDEYMNVDVALLRTVTRLEGRGSASSQDFLTSVTFARRSKKRDF